MSPLDSELREALHRRAERVTFDSADPVVGVERRARAIRRRRVAGTVAGAAVALAAVAVVVPGVIGGTGIDRRHADTLRPAGGSSPAPSAPAAAPTPTATATSTDPVAQGDPVNLLGWPDSRLSAGTPAELDPEARQAWGTAHNVPPDEVFTAPLWSGRLPTGDWVYALQAWTNSGSGRPIAHTVFFQWPGPGRGFLVQDLRTKVDAAGHSAEVSAVVAGQATPYIVVVGAPTTGQVRYAADGTTFRAVATQEGAAVFPRTGSVTIEVYNGDGIVTFRGQVDLGPSSPDI